MRKHNHIVVIGAGPTGLGAGHRLKELGHTDFGIYEQSPHVGGLASSFTDAAGFTWDIEAHVTYSHYSYFDQCFEKAMGQDFQLNTRESWVRMLDVWVPYPVQNNIRYLPENVRTECLHGLIDAQTHRDSKAVTNFQEFMDAVFGDGIVKHFMRPYCFKVWAHPAELMNKDWIGERVAVIDIDRAVRNVTLGLDDFGWGPNNRFRYPLFGGTGELYRRLARPLQTHLHLNKTVESIDAAQKRITFVDGEIVGYEKLISTMPLDLLCKQFLHDQIPQHIQKAAAQLRYSGGYMVGVGIRRPCPTTHSWAYFPEDNCPFYRVSYLSNFSPRMTPDPASHYSLLCETSFSEFKPVDGSRIVEETIQGLINVGLLPDRRDIVDIWMQRVERAYPTPTVERDSILAQTIPYLESQDICCRGRFGLWKYEVSNTDHCFMQGVELVNKWLLGDAETTVTTRYESTTHDRNTGGGSSVTETDSEI